LFASIAKIDEIPHGVDQGVHITHKYIDIVSLYYKDENVPKICKIILHPLSPMMQTYAFGDRFVLPSYSYDTPSMQIAWCPRSKLEKRSSVIANAIKKNSISGKEIEKFKVEMIGRINS